MKLTMHTYAEQPELKEQVYHAVKQTAWQGEFIFEDEVANRLWGRLESDFAAFQFALRDEDAQGTIVAVGHSLPLAYRHSLRRCDLR